VSGLVRFPEEWRPVSRRRARRGDVPAVLPTSLFIFIFVGIVQISVINLHVLHCFLWDCYLDRKGSFLTQEVLVWREWQLLCVASVHFFFADVVLQSEI